MERKMLVNMKSKPNTNKRPMIRFGVLEPEPDIAANFRAVALGKISQE